jgi:hypothetical protein
MCTTWLYQIGPEDMICLREPYSSGDCQKVDWKARKPICKTLKKLSHQLQPYREVVELPVEIHDEDFKKVKLNVREYGNI